MKEAVSRNSTDAIDNELNEPGSIIAMLREHRDFRLLTLGTIGTQSGQWILNVALGWLMLVLTDSAFWVGLVGFASGVPMLIASVPAGILLDRHSRKAILVVCQVLLVVVALVLTAIVLLELERPWLLLAGAFASGALMSVNNSARQTIVPDTVPRADMAGAVGLISSAQHVSRIFGPSLAGLIIGLWSVAGAFLFQALVLILALAASLTLQFPRRSSALAESGGDLLAGFRYLRANPLIRDLILIAAVPMFFIFPYLQLLPVFARDVLAIGADGLGLLMAFSGVGAVTGGLLASRGARIRRTGLFVLIATMIYSGIAMIIAGSETVFITAPAILCGSLLGSLYQSLNNTMILMAIEEDMRGRVTGIYMLTFGLYPLGGLPMGYVADLTSPGLAVAAGAVVSCCFAVALSLWSAGLRNISLADL